MTTENSAENMPSIQEVMAKVTAERAAAAPAAPAAETPPVEPAKAPASAEPAPAESTTPPEAETAPEPVPAPKPQRDPAGARFAALSRKEKELRAQAKQIETQQAEFARQQEALRAEQARASAAPKVKNPLDALKAAGFSYQDATQAILGNWEAPPEDPLEARFKPVQEKTGELESYVNRLEQQLTAMQTQLANERQQQSLNEVMSNIKAAVKAPEFELVQAMEDDGVELVRDIMAEYWNEHQAMLDYTEACKVAEDYYEKKLLTRMEKTGKMKARLTPPASASQQPSSKPAPTAPKSKPDATPATLTNDLATGSGEKVDLDSLDPEAAKDILARKLRFNAKPRR